MTDKQRRQIAHDVRIRVAAQQLTAQIFFDLFSIAMLEYGIPEDEVVKINGGVNADYIRLAEIWHEDTADKEYSFSVLDRRLQELAPRHFIQFETRYRELLGRV